MLRKELEEAYTIKIDLVDKDGLIQVGSDAASIESDDLDWYLVVEDLKPDKITTNEGKKSNE